MRFSRLFSLTALVVGLSLWTLAPYGGCSCNNPMGPNDGPSPTPSPTHGPVVDTFDSASLSDSPTQRPNNWRAASEKSVDTAGISAYNSEFVTGYGGSGAALHFFGNYGSPVAPGGQSPPTCKSPGYPFIAHRIYLNPGGTGAEENVTVSVPSGNAVGLRFWVKRGSAINGLIVKGILKKLSDYALVTPCNANAYHYHSFTIASGSLSTSWTQVSIPFSSIAWGGSWGADSKAIYAGTTLASPLCLQGGSLYLMALQFEPQNPSSFPGSAAFDFTIDNLEFY